MLLNGSRLTKTIQFSKQSSGIYRDVGDPIKQAMVYEAQGADEIMILDITLHNALLKDRGERLKVFTELVGEINNNLSIPLAAGGGVRTPKQAVRLVQAGAEKVVMKVGRRLITRHQYRRISEAIGQQSLVAAVDLKPGSVNGLVKALRAVADGAGEVLLTSIERDGMRTGYDLDTLKAMAPGVSVPLTVAGGCGKAQDMVEAVQAGASGVAVSSMFCFTDISPIKAKYYLRRQGIGVRI